MCGERVTSDRLSSSGSKCAREAETREELEVVGELKAEEEAVQKEGEEAEVVERRRRQQVCLKCKLNKQRQIAFVIRPRVYGGTKKLAKFQ